MYVTDYNIYVTISMLLGIIFKNLRFSKTFIYIKVPIILKLSQ